MNVEQQHLDKVIAYYETAQKYYFMMWHGRTSGLHYGIWGDRIGNRKDAILYENQFLAETANVKPKDVILDAGSGISGSGNWIAKNIGAKVVSLNVVDKQLKRGRELSAEKGVLKKVNFVGGDYHKLPFKDNSFNVFWSLESIEHSYELTTFASEAYRVLKPGGRAIIAGTFLGNTSPTDEQKSQMEVGMRAAGAFNDFRTAEEVSTLLEVAGFASVKYEEFTDHVMPSAIEMERMCKLGLPFAKIGNRAGLISDIMVDNTAWGTYQRELFQSGVTSYNIIFARKD